MALLLVDWSSAVLFEGISVRNINGFNCFCFFPSAAVNYYYRNSTNIIVSYYSDPRYKIKHGILEIIKTISIQVFFFYIKNMDLSR
jgi:hypothetical protein